MRLEVRERRGQPCSEDCRRAEQRVDGGEIPDAQCGTMMSEQRVAVRGCEVFTERDGTGSCPPRPALP